MGMYDYINGEQVKIFYHPIFDEQSKDTWHSGGSLKGYVDGDDIITRTLYYKRPKNFIVLDENKIENNPLIHVIKDSKIKATVYLKDADECLFYDNECIITYYGGDMGIKTKEDCYAYIKGKELSAEKYNEVTKEYNLVYNTRYIPTHWIMSHIKPSEAINRFRPDRKSKLEIIFRGINHIDEIKDLLKEKFDSCDELSTILETNNELWNKFCNIVYPVASKIHETSRNLLDELDTKNKPLIEKIEKDFQEKYPNRNLYEKEKQLGEFLECLRYMYQDREEERLIKQLPSNKERYIVLIEAIKEFVSTNENIINNYIEWMELNKDQASGIIEIFNCIKNNNDSISVGLLDEIINSFNK